jgi:hypothetical protein
MKLATELMTDPTTHSLWRYGDEMMGHLLTHLDSTVLTQLSGLVRKVFGEKLPRELALIWVGDHELEDDRRAVSKLIENLQGQVDLINELVWMRVPSFPGIPKVRETVMPKVEGIYKHIRALRDKREDARECFVLLEVDLSFPTGGKSAWYSDMGIDRGDVRRFSTSFAIPVVGDVRQGRAHFFKPLLFHLRNNRATLHHVSCALSRKPGSAPLP